MHSSWRSVSCMHQHTPPYRAIPGVSHPFVRNAQMSINRFVHKVAFPPPPTEKSVNFGDFLLICRLSLTLGPFLNQFCGQEFYGHPDFSDGWYRTICLVFMWYRASISEIPLFRGGIAPPLRMLSKGETLREGEGVSQPISHVETPKTP